MACQAWSSLSPVVPSSSREVAAEVPKQSDAVYIVRIWYESDGVRRIWRASVTDAYRNERRFFTTLETLRAYFGEGSGPALPSDSVGPGADPG